MDKEQQKKLIVEIMHADEDAGLYEPVTNGHTLTAMERKRLFDAMMYALDEDGHTGDWKVKFINDYIDRL